MSSSNYLYIQSVLGIMLLRSYGISVLQYFRPTILWIYCNIDSCGSDIHSVNPTYAT